MGSAGLTKAVKKAKLVNMEGLKRLKLLSLLLPVLLVPLWFPAEAAASGG